MSSQFQTNNPTSYFGVGPINPRNVWYRKRDPLTSDYKGYVLGDRWLNETNASIWTMTGRAASSGTWVPTGGSTVDVSNLTPDIGGIVYPTSGNINISGNATQGISTANVGASTIQVTASDASTTQKGVIKTASNADTLTGTSTTTSVTPDDLAVALGTRSANCIMLGEGSTSAMSVMGTGLTGQLVQSAGAGFDPGWTTATYPTTTNATEVLLSSANDTVVSSSNITATTAGIVTIPLQSGFSAYMHTALTNVLGTIATNLTVIFDSKDYDIQSEYSTTTGAFTATEAGIYQSNVCILFTNATAANTSGNIALFKNSGHWQQIQINPAGLIDLGGQFTAGFSTTVQMAASDTLSVVANIAGGIGDTVGISGGDYYTLWQVSKIA